MKYILVFILFWFSFSETNAQYDPFITDPVINPSPYKVVGSTATATFSIGNSGACPLDRFNEIPCNDDACRLRVRINLSDGSSEPASGQAFAAANPTADLSGTAVSWFTWTYDDFNSQWQGVQNQTIGSGAGGTIIVNMRHIVGSPMSAPNNGLNVNLEPLSYGNGPATPADWTTCAQRPLSGGNVEANDQFSQYTYLPIQLTEFKASYLGNWQSKLDWTTLNEINSSKFEIERRIGNNQSWSRVASVPSSGLTAVAKNYKHVDKFYETNERVYYRINQIDLDGSSRYTEIKSVQPRVGNLQISGFPNPVKDQFQLQIVSKKEEKISMDIVDVLGRLVSRETFTIKEGSNTKNLRLGNFVAGTYFIKVAGTDSNESLTVLKVD